VIRQVNYIIYAILILSTAGVGLRLIRKIPSAIVVEKENDFYCGTEMQQPQNFSAVAAKGKNLFFGKCASCHNIYKDGTGPALLGFEERGPWSDQSKLHEWIKDPSAFMKKDSYTKKLKEKFGSMMAAFPDISKEEVEAIAQYITVNNVD
jgi:mono/diheme cytochrome c family protein